MIVRRPFVGVVAVPAVALGTALLLIGEGSCTNREAASAQANADTVFADDFESGTLALWPDGVNPSRHRVVTDPSFAQSGSRYLEATYVPGGDGGWLTRFFPPGYDSLYVSYYVRFPADWQGGTKLIALYGSRTDDQWSGLGKAGICPTGADFFATMVIAEFGGNPGATRFYTYYPAMAREGDRVTCWGRYGDGTETYMPPLTLSLGGWHHIEFWVKLNVPGQHDGGQQFWVDGALRGSWSGLSFRESSVLMLNAVQLNFNRGFSGGPMREQLYVDHLVVLRARPPSYGDPEGFGCTKLERHADGSPPTTFFRAR